MEGRGLLLLVSDAVLALPDGEAILADVNTMLNAGDVTGEAPFDQNQGL